MDISVIPFHKTTVKTPRSTQSKQQTTTLRHEPNVDHWKSDSILKYGISLLKIPIWIAWCLPDNPAFLEPPCTKNALECLAELATSPAIDKGVSPAVDAPYSLK